MTRKRRTGNGAAFAFFAGVGALVTAAMIAATACSSAFGDALDGRRGGDAVVTATPALTGDPTSTPPPAPTSPSPPPNPTVVAAPDQDAAETPHNEVDTTSPPPNPGFDDPGDEATMLAAWIYDGDTFRAKTEQGRSVDVRLIGINAPESDECFGQESTDMLIDLIGRENVEVSTIAFDEYGRRLADVTLNGSDVNLAMVAQGGALALHSDRGERLVALSEAEQQARDQGLGMWAAGCIADTTVAIETVNYDAEGRDDLNVNGEWVLVVNHGPATSLRGWGLRDESTRHRFTFPDDLTVGTNERVIIYSGCETDPPSQVTPPDADHVLYWCDPWGPLWTNRGDSAYLTDTAGATVDIFAWS